MKLSEVTTALCGLEKIAFRLPSGEIVPSHFHITEVGKIQKHFIDCGGTVRNEEVVNFQLWTANDFDHRLAPDKLLTIIELSQRVLGITDGEIEVEYQGRTIEKYGLEFDGREFWLTTKQTDCLAKDKCNIPAPAKRKVRLSELQKQTTCCSPDSGCC